MWDGSSVKRCTIDDEHLHLHCTGDVRIQGVPFGLTGPSATEEWRRNLWGSFLENIIIYLNTNYKIRSSQKGKCLGAIIIHFIALLSQFALSTKRVKNLILRTQTALNNLES